MFNLTGNCNLFQMALPFCIPTSSVRAPINTHPVNTHTGQFCLPLGWYEMAYYCGFNFNSSNNDIGHICICLFAIHVSFFVKYLLQSFAWLSGFSLRYGFTSFLFTGYKLIVKICIPNISSQYVTYHFIFLKVSFE